MLYCQVATNAICCIFILSLQYLANSSIRVLQMNGDKTSHSFKFEVFLHTSNAVFLKINSNVDIYNNNKMGRCGFLRVSHALLLQPLTKRWNVCLNV